MQTEFRVLVVTNTYPTTEKPGDSPQIRDQVEALRSQGAKVDVLYIDRYKGVWGYIRAAFHIFRLTFQKKKYDLLQAYYGHSGLLASFQAKYPVFVTFLGSDLLHPRDAVIGKIAARLADGVIVQSEEMKAVVKRNDAIIVPFGVNFNIFSDASLEKTRQMLGFREDEKNVLFPWDPGRAVKRFDLIQEAVQIVQKKYPQTKIIAVYNQPHEEVAKYMQGSDVLVLASMHEGSPMAIREAMACNLPIVAVDVGDVRQIIETTEGCYLCERDPADIAEKIIRVFQNGVRTNGANVIRQASADWGAKQLIKLYKQVLN